MNPESEPSKRIAALSTSCLSIARLEGMLAQSKRAVSLVPMMPASSGYSRRTEPTCPSIRISREKTLASRFSDDGIKTVHLDGEREASERFDDAPQPRYSPTIYRIGSYPELSLRSGELHLWHFGFDVSSETLPTILGRAGIAFSTGDATMGGLKHLARLAEIANRRLCPSASVERTGT